MDSPSTTHPIQRCCGQEAGQSLPCIGRALFVSPLSTGRWDPRISLWPLSWVVVASHLSERIVMPLAEMWTREEWASLPLSGFKEGTHLLLICSDLADGVIFYLVTPFSVWWISTSIFFVCLLSWLKKRVLCFQSILEGQLLNSFLVLTGLFWAFSGLCSSLKC